MPVGWTTVNTVYKYVQDRKEEASGVSVHGKWKDVLRACLPWYLEHECYRVGRNGVSIASGDIRFLSCGKSICPLLSGHLMCVRSIYFLSVQGIYT